MADGWQRCVPPCDVALWTMAMDGTCAPWYPRGRTWLDGDERARAARFCRPEDRDLFIAAHALLRATLAEAVGAAPAALRFERAQPFGKPQLAADGRYPDLRFSLSHCDGLVAVAHGPRTELGVDVEPLDRKLDPGAARLVLTPDELAACESDDPAVANRARMRAWVRKESAVKATGRGLSEEMSGFAILGRPPRLAGGSFGSGAGWSIAELQPTPRHFLALTVAAPTVALQWRQIRPDRLGRAQGAAGGPPDLLTQPGAQP